MYKTILLIPVIGLCLAMLIHGCSKDPAVEKPIDIKGTFSFTANGARYNWDFTTTPGAYGLEKPHFWKDYYNPHFYLSGTPMIKPDCMIQSWL